MKMTNNSATYEAFVKQRLRAILDISEDSQRKVRKTTEEMATTCRACRAGLERNDSNKKMVHSVANQMYLIFNPHTRACTIK